MLLKFRKAGKDELDTALKLLQAAATTLKEKSIRQWEFWLNPTKEKIEWIEQGFDNHEFYFLEDDNHQLVGMFRLMSEDELYWGKQELKAGYIHSLVVDKKYAGKQIGQKIIAEVEFNLPGKGIFILRLDCNASNTALCQYYENLGFKKVGEKQMPHSLNYLYEKKLS